MELSREALSRVLPEGVPVPARWLRHVGLTSSAVSRATSSGSLQATGGQAYLRPGPALTWATVLYGAQQTGTPLHLGHTSALALHGLAHYLALGSQPQQVYLLGKRPPIWLMELGELCSWRWHHERVIQEQVEGHPSSNLRMPNVDVPAARLLGVEPVKHEGWTLLISSPERAAIELAAGLTRGESWDTAYQTFSGLTSLRPRLVGKLLEACPSRVTRRVFIHLARESQQPWLKHTNWQELDLGRGKRQVVAGGRLDKELGITVPSKDGEDQSGF